MCEKIEDNRNICQNKSRIFRQKGERHHNKFHQNKNTKLRQRALVLQKKKDLKNNFEVKISYKNEASA